MEPIVALTTGESSKKIWTPQILIAMAEPAMANLKPIIVLDIDIKLAKHLHNKRNSSKKVQNLQKLFATIKPTMTSVVLISTIEKNTSQFHIAPLKDI